MPRAKKNIHGSPATAGVQNMAEYTEKHKGTDDSMKMILPVYNIGMGNRQNYNGQYDEESLGTEIHKFFEYCAENEIKVAKQGLMIWLGISRETYNRWQKSPDLGFKYDMITGANKIMEWGYIQRGESYPTFNQFLLKAAHGMVEPQKIEITSANNVSKEEVADAISKLGLDEEDE